MKQGDPLSPLFINIFINDLFTALNTSNSCRDEKFADDLILLSTTRGTSKLT